MVEAVGLGYGQTVGGEMRVGAWIYGAVSLIVGTPFFSDEMQTTGSPNIDYPVP